jgi:hypothetical protein
MTDHDRRDDGWATLARLLYRYLWPMWMFRDASRGSALERAAAYRHNRSHRRHLPGYAGKWMAIAMTTLGAIRSIELAAQASAACTYACAVLALWLAWAVIVAVVLIAVWIYMETVPG